VSLVDIKKVDALLAVARSVVPRNVKTDGDFEDWRVIGPGLVAIATDLFEGIASSPPPRGRVRAEVLARSLAEYAITFAWLAGPVVGREGRIKRLLKDEYREREKTENRLVDHIVPKARYADLVEKGSIPRSVVSTEMKERMSRLLGDDSIRTLPSALEMAFDADDEWMDRIELTSHYPYTFIYFQTFGGMSPLTHPSITAIGRVVTRQGDKTVVGMPEVLGQSSGPYGAGFLALLSTLWVASETFDWPDPADLMAVTAAS
jgi:hypothetical protein